MTQRLGRLPYWELRFDTSGDADPDLRRKLLDGVPQEGVTDLVVFSHGWNNDPEAARQLYRRFFGLLEPLLRDAAPERRVGVAGVIWPSMAWLDEPIPDFPAAQGGAAGLAEPQKDADLVAALTAVFPEPEQRRSLDELAGLLAARPEDPAALSHFQELLGALVTADPLPDAPGEDAGEIAMLTEEPADLYGRFLAAEETLAGGPTDLGGAAGLRDRAEGLWKGARTALRQATYFVMKRRAGTVGQEGLGPLLGRLQEAAPSLRVHLVGHSFGARLVSYALAGLPGTGTSSPVKSLVLLQGAFSHFAFADALPHDRARSGALAGRMARVDGPLVCCFSVHDTAVGTLYPLSSFGSRSDASGTDDLSFRWGAMGHDGAQGVQARQVDVGPVGSDYPFAAGRFLNVDAGDVIRQGRPLSGAHSDIFHPELAWLAASAAGLVQARADARAGAPGR